MKQHLFQLLLMFLLMAFGSQQELLASERMDGTMPETDRIYDNSSRHVPFGEALITDGHDGCHIAAPRVQRLPATGHGRSAVHRLAQVSQKTITTLVHARYDGRRRREAAPHERGASCQYYVIALRRILC